MKTKHFDKFDLKKQRDKRSADKNDNKLAFAKEMIEIQTGINVKSMGLINFL